MKPITLIMHVSGPDEWSDPPYTYAVDILDRDRVIELYNHIQLADRMFRQANKDERERLLDGVTLSDGIHFMTSLDEKVLEMKTLGSERTVDDEICSDGWASVEGAIDLDENEKGTTEGDQLYISASHEWSAQWLEWTCYPRHSSMRVHTPYIHTKLIEDLYEMIEEETRQEEGQAKMISPKVDDDFDRLKKKDIPFDKGDIIHYLETALWAMQTNFDRAVGEELDITDEEVTRLRRQLHNWMIKED